MGNILIQIKEMFEEKGVKLTLCLENQQKPLLCRGVYL